MIKLKLTTILKILLVLFKSISIKKNKKEEKLFNMQRIVPLTKIPKEIKIIYTLFSGLNWNNFFEVRKVNFLKIGDLKFLLIELGEIIDSILSFRELYACNPSSVR